MAIYGLEICLWQVHAWNFQNGLTDADLYILRRRKNLFDLGAEWSCSRYSGAYDKTSGTMFTTPKIEGGEIDFSCPKITQGVNLGADHEKGITFQNFGHMR